MPGTVHTERLNQLVDALINGQHCLVTGSAKRGKTTLLGAAQGKLEGIVGQVGWIDLADDGLQTQDSDQFYGHLCSKLSRDATTPQSKKRTKEGIELFQHQLSTWCQHAQGSVLFIDGLDVFERTGHGSRLGPFLGALDAVLGHRNKQPVAALCAASRLPPSDLLALGGGPAERSIDFSHHFPLANVTRDVALQVARRCWPSAPDESLHALLSWTGTHLADIERLAEDVPELASPHDVDRGAWASIRADRERGWARRLTGTRLGGAEAERRQRILREARRLYENGRIAYGPETRGLALEEFVAIEGKHLVFSSRRQAACFDWPSLHRRELETLDLEHVLKSVGVDERNELDRVTESLERFATPSAASWVESFYRKAVDTGARKEEQKASAAEAKQQHHRTRARSAMVVTAISVAATCLLGYFYYNSEQGFAQTRTKVESDAPKPTPSADLTRDKEQLEAKKQAAKQSEIEAAQARKTADEQQVELNKTVTRLVQEASRVGLDKAQKQDIQAQLSRALTTAREAREVASKKEREAVQAKASLEKATSDVAALERTTAALEAAKKKLESQLDTQNSLKDQVQAAFEKAQVERTELKKTVAELQGKLDALANDNATCKGDLLGAQIKIKECENTRPPPVSP